MTEVIKEEYDQKTYREHVLLRTGMYAGTKKLITNDEYIINDTFEDIIVSKEELIYPPALYKIFDEIIVNAIDHVTRTMNYKGSNKCNIIKCYFNKLNGEIKVYNNGVGIEISKFKDKDFYIPQLIFSEPLSGSNFNDNIDSIVGGTNGSGSKITNILSEYFIVETIDSSSKQYYYQKFEDGNLIKNDPIIEKSKDKSMTTITFKPNYKLFYTKKGYTPEVGELLEKLFKTRMYYVSIFCKNTKIYFNDKELCITKLEQFANLIIPDKSNLISTKLISKTDPYEWDIVIGIDNNNNDFSLINGIVAKQGTHFKHIEKLIKTNLKDKLEKLMKGKNKINNNVITDNLVIFMKGHVVNCDWKSQSKNELGVEIKQFKNYKFDDKIYIKLWKKLKEQLTEIYLSNELTDLDKTNGSKKKKVKSDKLVDAEYAGSNESYKCKLFLTEGDSAATYADTGLGDIGHEYYGIFPLKGKLLNVRGQTADKINKNAEITELKKIIGLKNNHKYTDLNELRYGGIITLTDSDVDGYHIKSLIINMIHSFWPELIELGFICSFATQIIKVTKSNQIINFYTEYEYEEWHKNNNTDGWKTSYYKGLGTSTDDDISDNFKDFNTKLITYKSDKNINDSMELAFNKKLTNERKDWLLNYDRSNIIKQVEKHIDITDVINKELIQFSYHDTHRSIPSVMDGFKPTQRKIIYTSLNYIKNTNEKQKLITFGARCIEKTSYHHGDASMYGTIINMAQTYTGSNNCNYLLPLGQFGSRIKNGTDAASPRYIFTNINKVLPKMIKKIDNKLLNYLISEDVLIEPEYYLPVLPNILINGSKGIGTGFSTDVLPHKLEDVANYILCKLNNKRIKKFNPYYRNFKGTIVETSLHKYNVIGTYEFNDKTRSLIISELPIGISTIDYIKFLEDITYDKSADKKLIKDQCITKFKNKGTKDNILFELVMKKDVYNEIKQLDHKDILIKFKLIKPISESNMYLFDRNNNIKKYKNIYEILDYFYEVRLEYYIKRKTLMLNELKLELLILENKIRFIKNIINKTIKIMNVKKSKLQEQLENMDFYKYKESYDYLTDMSISTLTQERLIKLDNEMNNKHNEVNELENTEVKTLWINDINELIDENNKYNIQLLNEKNKQTNKKNK